MPTIKAYIDAEDFVEDPDVPEPERSNKVHQEVRNLANTLATAFFCDVTSRVTEDGWAEITLTISHQPHLKGDKVEAVKCVLEFFATVEVLEEEEAQ